MNPRTPSLDNSKIGTVWLIVVMAVSICVIIQLCRVTMKRVHRFREDYAGFETSEHSDSLLCSSSESSQSSENSNPSVKSIQLSVFNEPGDDAYKSGKYKDLDSNHADRGSWEENTEPTKPKMTMQPSDPSCLASLSSTTSQADPTQIPPEVEMWGKTQTMLLVFDAKMRVLVWSVGMSRVRGGWSVEGRVLENYRETVDVRNGLGTCLFTTF